MGNSEPSLAPEWLRTSGSGTGGGGVSHHFASSQSDGRGPRSAPPKRNRSSMSIGNSGIHSVRDWSSSSNSGRRTLSNNGSAKLERNQNSRAYSSFSRRPRDRDRGRLPTDYNWDTDYSDPLRSVLSRTIEKDPLRHSQSMVSRKQSEVLQQRDSADLRHARQNDHVKGNGLLSVGNTEKIAFDKNFPLLGSEERPLTSDIVRVPSPGLSNSIQGLSIGNSALIGVECWTSALAEVPVGVGGTTVSSMVNQPAVASSASSVVSSASAVVSSASAVVSSASAASSTTTGLNMAETLVQAPSGSHSSQQPSLQNQKREELAILQSMRLIPMTPSTPKNLALNPSDKLKAKTAARSGDQVPALKNGHQLPSLQSGNQPARAANVKTDGTNTSHTGKMLVLKPGRENGVLLSLVDTSNPTGSVTSKVNGHHHPGTSIRAPAASKNPVNHKLSDSTKISAFVLSPGSKDDKKSSLAQARSRSDFFNLMRKKSMSSPSHAECSHVVSTIGEKSDELENGSSAPVNPFKEGELKCDEDACMVSFRLDESPKNDSGDNAAIVPDEKEFAFLRSLGWEENAADEGGLTQEEIKAFFEEYKRLKPASKRCISLQMMMSAQPAPPTACSGGPCSDFGLSDSSS